MDEEALKNLLRALVATASAALKRQDEILNELDGVKTAALVKLARGIADDGKTLESLRKAAKFLEQGGGERTGSDLEQRLREDLLKSGFPSEMRALQEFSKQGWRCYGSGGYFDLDQSQTRETDIRATWVRLDGDVLLDYSVFCEVKKSIYPWVVFVQESQNTEDDESDSLWGFQHVLRNIENPAITFSNIIDQSAFSDGSLGYSVYESFRGADQWYGAAITACKAAHAYVRSRIYREGNLLIIPSGIMALAHPVVILDGILKKSFIAPDGNIVIEAAKVVPMRLMFGTSKYDSFTYTIDLVTLEHLPEYVTGLLSRAKRLLSVLQPIPRSAKVST